ncbi:MAG: DNA-3-methyladenine glycosylase [Chloroflexota bacterium]|nr:DNA-3-methyladenine glycosylase [Chloroflexota bacterium]
MPVAKLPRSFYARHAVEVAPDLLGKLLVRSLPEGVLKGRIVETEAYTGTSDPGSHAYRGPTPRNQVMFGPAGHVYVYLSYGMHHCMNVVTDDPGVAGAVLLRALEPIAGLDIMERNRKGRLPAELLNGPGKICQAYHISREQNGADLESSDIWIERDGFQADRVRVGTRVGITVGADLPYRFSVDGSPWVSRGKSHDSRV